MIQADYISTVVVTFANMLQSSDAMGHCPLCHHRNSGRSPEPQDYNKKLHLTNNNIIYPERLNHFRSFCSRGPVTICPLFTYMYTPPAPLTNHKTKHSSANALYVARPGSFPPRHGDDYAGLTTVATPMSGNDGQGGTSAPHAIQGAGG